MLEWSISPLETVFAKTSEGKPEMQARSLGLSAMARRVLVLVDGRRSGTDLAAFVPAGNIETPLSELLSRSCIEAVARQATPPSAPAPASTSAPSLAFASAGRDAASRFAESVQPSSLSSPLGLPAEAVADPLAQLPPAETRTGQDLEKARNFMTNTVNNIFGHHNRISLVESIFSCQSSSQLRRVYPAWAQALATKGTGKKRLPELSQKLFTVL